MTNTVAAVVGAGPAGLMAAEVLAGAGLTVDVFDAMPSPGRKLLMAGRGGLNITHSESLASFRRRYGAGGSALAPFLDRLGPEELRAWIHGLGIETFIGTSGRIFPKEMKAAPLLRAWLRRLRGMGVRLHMRHRWQGWANNGALCFAAPQGDTVVEARAVVLALGGASWPQLGSDGTWTHHLARRGVPLSPFKASNCGFEVQWSEHFSTRFAGAPVKPVAIESRQGEFIVTAYGIEGGLIYGASAGLRDAIERDGTAVVRVDLCPDRSERRLLDALNRPRGRASFATYLRKAAGLEGVRAGLVRELVPEAARAAPAALAAAIKSLPIVLRAPRPIAEAISTAGGVSLSAVDERLMLRALPGVFVAGEMLDWEAPTGGYLLTACFATGHAAGQGVVQWLARDI